MVQLEFDFNERKKTAVEWFNQQLVDRQNGKGDSRSWNEILEQAKAMEKQQSEKYAEFCVRCDRAGIKLIDFNDYIKL